MTYKIKPLLLIFVTLVFFSALANEEKPSLLGNGFPGIIKNIPETTPEISSALLESGSRLYTYTRAQIAPEDARLVKATCPTNSISFIAHEPQKIGKRYLPLIVEFKFVPDNLLSPDQINKNLFSAIETKKLTKQLKKDFVAISILAPKSLNFKSSNKGERTEPSKLAMDAILGYCRKLGVSGINTNQIFIVAEDKNAIDNALDFYIQYPNKFSLFISKDTIPSPSRFNYTKGDIDKIAIYHSSNASPAFFREAESFKYRIDKLGGNFELIKYDGASQNPWDNPDFIGWMLTHTTNGLGIKGNKKNVYDPQNPSFINGIKCSTSEEILPQKKFWPMAAADGNEKTYFQSANMVKQGGWWMAEFERPICGRVTIECGILKRKTLQELYGNMRVEVSSDGVKWQSKGIISKKKGSFSFFDNSKKIKFVRVISYSQQEIRLIVREITIEEQL